MPSQFENLCGPNKPLKPEPADAKEFAGLVRSGKARLKDASSKTLALESRFDLAYNAAHALCLAALRWHSYRSSQRYIVFQLLPHFREALINPVRPELVEGFLWKIKECFDRLNTNGE